MQYSEEEVFEYINENDVKFIKLTFCDIFGNLKNISILSSQMKRAIDVGISIDASAIKGFGTEEKSDLLLFPDLNTLSLLPWRPSQGRVIRFYCNVKYPNGKDFEMDSRRILMDAVKELKNEHITCNIGAECEFYLFKKDDYDSPTTISFDKAGYLDIAPDDKGEDVRREICLTLENMNIIPEASHHEEGPGQNEIDFKYSDPLSAADNISTVKAVIKTVSDHYGLFASFNPKPIIEKPGNGLHINISTTSVKHNDCLMSFMAGIMRRIKEITLFLNTKKESYARLGAFKAPKYITWSRENRSQLIRIPAAKDEYERIELRSPDPMLNPYIAYALLIYAGIEGVKENLVPDEAVNINLFNVSDEELKKYKTLPLSYDEAYENACKSEFVRKIIPPRFLEAFQNNK